MVRSGPYQQRSARSQLDVALVAAALEQHVRLYFLGAAVLQLQSERELSVAHLPAGYRAWASLPGLTDVAAFAEPIWIERLAAHQIKTVLWPEPMTRQQMRADWQDCQRMLVL